MDEGLKQQLKETIDQLHKTADYLQSLLEDGQPTVETPAEPARELPKDKRVIRTKSSGDRVYQLDEVKKLRQWITSGEVLEALGWDQTNVVTIDDAELLRYQLSSPIYKAPEKASDVA